jgi:hypothetical protein
MLLQKLYIKLCLMGTVIIRFELSFYVRAQFPNLYPQTLFISNKNKDKSNVWTQQYSNPSNLFNLDPQYVQNNIISQFFGTALRQLTNIYLSVPLVTYVKI